MYSTCSHVTGNWKYDKTVLNSNNSINCIIVQYVYVCWFSLEITNRSISSDITQSICKLNDMAISYLWYNLTCTILLIIVWLHIGWDNCYIQNYSSIILYDSLIESLAFQNNLSFQLWFFLLNFQTLASSTVTHIIVMDIS